MTGSLDGPTITCTPAAATAFLWVALSIALGAVLGRYHYAADAILGAAAAVAVFAAESILFPTR